LRGAAIIFAWRKTNKHADPACLLRLLGTRRQRPEHYNACHTGQELAPSKKFS